MNIIVLTLFKEMFEPFVTTSIIKRAIEKKLVSIEIVDIRDFTKDKHKRVDFPPYGGGSGMVISCEPLSSAIDYAIDKILSKSSKKPKIVYMSPRGKLLNYNLSKSISDDDYNYIIICGHYEGFDERIKSLADEIISIGDFVLTGGELPAMMITDSVVRLLDGVITDDSLTSESFSDNLLDYPVYTKPSEYRGMKVPDILLSGDHKKIDEYRQSERIRVTKEKRNDLLGE